MPRLIIAVLFFAVMFALLCGPVLAVALRLRRQGDGGALRSLRAVWAAEVIVAAGLIFAADALGLSNPAGWVLAIIAGVGLSGAASFAMWRTGLRMLGARRRR
jgi:hypothetical protein